MAYEFIEVSKQDRVGIITLNRPQALNALNSALMAELVDALETFNADPEVGAVLLRGSDKAFAAGADIKEMMNKSPVDLYLDENLERWDRVARQGKPVVAAVSGWALGGGLELCMACDIVVASETAKFGQPEINLGIIPGAGGTQRLPRAVGKSLAMLMILSGEPITAQEGLQHGLVARVYPPDRYMDEALNLCRKIAAKPGLALRVAKECVRQSFELPLAEGLEFERRSFYMLFASEDQKEGMEAFVEKRQGNFKGR